MNNKLQESFMRSACLEKARVSIYLNNGVRLSGFIKNFDNFCILLEKDGVQQLLFKHAISTIMPEVRLNGISAIEFEKE